MTPENPRSQPHETQPQEASFRELVIGFLQSDRFNSYASNTQYVYLQDLRRFLDFAEKHGTESIPEFVSIFDSYSKDRRLSSNYRERSALRSALNWGIIQGLAEDKMLARISPNNEYVKRKHPKGEEPFSNDELQKLLDATSQMPRDKALILTIISARTSSDGIRSLTTRSLESRTDGKTVLVVGDKPIILPRVIGDCINDYAKSIEPGPLFANRKGRPLTRAYMDLIFKKYQGALGFDVNYSSLVRTGKKFFGTQPEMLGES